MSTNVLNVPKRRSKRMMKLRISTGDIHKESIFTLEALTIGRLQTSTIALDDKKASREHARIEKVGDGYRLTDLQSNNGTRVNGEKVLVHKLQEGDEIQIGDTLLTVLELDTPPPPAPEDETSIPLEKKMEVKRRIEEVRSNASTNAFWTRVAIAAACVIVIAGLAAYIASLPSSPPPARRQASEKDQKLQDLKDEAERRLALARRDAATTGFDPDQVARDAKEYGKYLLTIEGVDPFTHLLQLEEKRKLQPVDPAKFAHQLEAARRESRIALGALRYGEALRILAKVASLADAKQAETLAPLLDDVKRIIGHDYEQVRRDAELLIDKGDFEGAKKLFLISALRFSGTEYETQLAAHASDVTLLARASGGDTLAHQPSPEEPKKDEPAPPSAAAILTAKLGKAVKEGLFTSPVKFSETISGIPGSADESGLTLKNETKLAWDEIDPKVLFRLYGQCKFEGDEWLVLAEWAHEKTLESEANRTLHLYLVRNQDSKGKVDEVLSRWRGASVPEGGYTYHSKLGVWENKTEIANRLAREEAQKLGKDLVAATDPKKIDVLVGKLLEHHHNTDLLPETREFVKTTALESIRANKKKRLDAIASKAKNAAGFERLRNARMELDRRREAALKVIYDPKIYLPENHPDYPKGDKVNGQEEVDRLVGAVRELWEQGGAYVASLDPSIRRDIEAVQEIDSRTLREFGEEPTEDDLQDFEEIMNNLNAKVDLKSFALTAQDRKLWEWNRWVDKYNEALNDPDVTKEEKDHFKVLNDYREMMGRRRLFLDARLNRATKKHSDVCNRAQRIWHEGSDGSPQSRAQAEGFTAGVGENIAIGYGSPGEIWTRGWYRASDHHRNGLSDSWNCGGYGYVGNVGTQNFSNITPPKSK